MDKPTEQSTCLDNTKLSGYKTCPRYHFIRQVLGWKRVGTAAPLVFGSSWHAAMDAVWEHGPKLDQRSAVELGHMAFLQKWEADGYDPDPDMGQLEYLGARNPSVAHEMLIAYVQQRWKMIQGCNVLAIEQPFAVPMPGMENVWYVGRLDKVVEWTGQRLILEHKSTTAYATVGNFRTEYVESWGMDSQVKGYQFGGAMYYGNIDAVWIDAALVHKKVHDAYKFIPVAHGFPILEEWIGDAIQWADRVIKEEAEFVRCGELKPGMFPKNEGSCYGKYGPCSFVDICRTTADPSKLAEPPPGYVVEPWNPFDVLMLDKIVNEPGE